MTASVSRDRACKASISARRLLLAAAVTGLALLSPSQGRAAEPAVTIPPPALDEPLVPGGETEAAVLAGGCFWGVQGVFQHVKGVISAVSGYAGGDKATAHYGIVGTGATGHAESVRIVFDPRQISYGRILQIYFSVAHDPTQLNRQGPDSGTQYRSAIFTQGTEQAKVAKAYIAQLNQARVFDAAIVTKISQLNGFYPAEDYHQNYLTLHPDSPYIEFNDLPKIESLRQIFPDRYRADPVLVATSAPSN
ncbi:MAG TPA: peptide-methionine (S)-S-oxide reductase MsrA [Xanthobacteraceae bacterium]